MARVTSATVDGLAPPLPFLCMLDEGLRTMEEDAAWEAGVVAISIRAARSDDGLALRAIEVLAGEGFRDIGMAEVADDEPDSVETLAAYACAGRSWVAVDADDRPVGYVVASEVMSGWGSPTGRTPTGGTDDRLDSCYC